MISSFLNLQSLVVIICTTRFNIQNSIVCPFYVCSVSLLQRIFLPKFRLSIGLSNVNTCSLSGTDWTLIDSYVKFSLRRLS
jgi:hypothetical protein